MFLQAANDLSSHLVKIRREIHQHPESGFKEFKTSALVKEQLNRIGGFRIREVAGTGVVADIGEPPYLLLRADMDALEIEEQTGKEYASQVPGMMHACGHDAHTTMLLGAAELIAGNADRLKSGARLMFQPCEETGPGGALSMIKEGVLDDVGGAVALHVYPTIDCGHIALRNGAMMANADDFDVTFFGTPGHASTPHKTRDAVLAAAEFVVRVQKIVSRYFDPFDNVVVTVGKIESGTRRNIIPGESKLYGTVRTLTDQNRGRARRLLEATAESVSLEMDLKVEFDFIEGYPVLMNNPGMTDFVRTTSAAIIGSANVVEVEFPSMGGEDFAYIAQKVPTCFFQIGTGNEDPATRFSAHHSRFDIDESCLPIGAAILAELASQWISKLNQE